MWCYFNMIKDYCKIIVLAMTSWNIWTGLFYLLWILHSIVWNTSDKLTIKIFRNFNMIILCRDCRVFLITNPCSSLLVRFICTLSFIYIKHYLNEWHQIQNKSRIDYPRKKEVWTNSRTFKSWGMQGNHVFKFCN